MNLIKANKTCSIIKKFFFIIFLTIFFIPSTYSQSLQNRDTVKTLEVQKDQTLLVPIFLDDTNIQEEIKSMYISIAFNDEVIDKEKIGIQVQNGILLDYSFNIFQFSDSATIIIIGQGATITQGSIVELLLKPLSTGTTSLAIESLNCNDNKVSGGFYLDSNYYRRIYIKVNEPEEFKILEIKDVFVLEDEPINPIPFTINVPDNSIKIQGCRAITSNTDLIPQRNLSIRGSDLNRHLYITGTVSNQFGTSDITVQAFYDNMRESTQSVFTINVLPVNDPPDFSMPSYIELPETSGPQIFPEWVTNISAGAENENDQSLEFIIYTDQTNLFYEKPEIDLLTGNLTFFPVDNINGDALVSVFLKDNGGNENGGKNLSISKNFTLSITPFTPSLSDNPIYKLTCITSNQPISSQSVSSIIRIMTCDSDGNAVVVESDTNIWLKTEASETGWFYVKNSESNWFLQKSNAIIVIPEGEYSAMFKYINAKPGNWKITASEMPDLNWVDATLNIKVENDYPDISGDINKNGEIDLSDIIRTMQKISH